MGEEKKFTMQQVLQIVRGAVYALNNETLRAIAMSKERGFEYAMSSKPEAKMQANYIQGEVHSMERMRSQLSDVENLVWKSMENYGKKEEETEEG